ncbi:peptidoglycan endopeptidase [Mesorhizobium sp. M4A.F.Ca.ET.020.02.1.1]|uniref:C40 family peptidase n=1 Tax=unclassified Mesorhizobium TaxID=325217 RepID=UPI000FCB0CCA|nr:MULTISPECIES: NlpC/P60 family protein [unclassified Mesorhizobium]RUX51719.1 peptidoglycan endopeptidase [Mesorhizobium sp. M4A.F.Ca.ET.050.02.1.1]RVD43781.1 peptidoglycan endopeptidase [Mesorhizobium sp. M4A.F.Ca.ET.020.02.1.1]RWC21291.1 MAG: peptidoglycan endopeptidase [Mesorhizobium sp.]RWD36612.1 MAG: peptidoglycan endopeptidase [Mesorhizobium sp.]TIL78795.1 MAG: NlpC/P60 family protein [Mesorhizobium sp.]
MTARDARLHAFRSDLADARLKGEVSAERFVAGLPARISVPVADLRKSPRWDAGVNTQAVFGDDVLVFEEREGWAWIQAERDGYVGYVADTVLGARDHAPTHVVSVPRTFLYPGPDLRIPVSGQLSMGSAVTVTGPAETRGTPYALLSSGQALIAAHLRSIGEVATDYVSVAEGFLGTPYLWGGVSGFGIDCSGLVQLAMRMTGKDVLRDSDMQAASIGEPLDPGPDFAGLRRGDLVFWKGHVAIMTDPDTMIHANGHTMLVSREGLKEAVERIGYLYGGPTGFRRP